MAQSRLLAADACAMELEPLDLDSADVLDGSPATHLSALVSVGAMEIGVWGDRAGHPDGHRV